MNQNSQPLYEVQCNYFNFHLIVRIFIATFFVHIIKKTHISALPAEVLMYIFKWVVSLRLDLRSLEKLAQVKVARVERFLRIPRSTF